MLPGGFHVCVHDVHPCFREPLDVLLAELQTRVGDCFSLAVTPRYGGDEPPTAAWDFLREAAIGLPDLLAHGETHRRSWNLSPFSFANGFADEWGGGGDDPAAFVRSVVRSREAVAGIFERSVRAAVAPCYAHPPLRSEDLGAFGFDTWMGYRGVLTWWGRFPIQTTMYDWGRVHRVGPALGAMTRNRRGPRVLVLHPQDVPRGWHRRAFAVLDAWLAAGGRAVPLRELKPET